VRIELERGSKWVKLINPSSKYPETLFAYEYKLEGKYYVLVLCRQIGRDKLESLSLYFLDKNTDDLYYMDNLLYNYNSYFKFDTPLDRSIKLGHMNLEKFKLQNKIKKYDEDIKDYLLDLLDYGLEISEEVCGYTQMEFPKKDEDGYRDTQSSEVYFPRSPQYTELKYVYHLDVVDRNIENDIKQNDSVILNEKFNSFKKKIQNFKLKSDIFFDKDVTKCVITLY
jgi:hypothetical protein